MRGNVRHRIELDRSGCNRCRRRRIIVGYRRSSADVKCDTDPEHGARVRGELIGAVVGIQPVNPAPSLRRTVPSFLPVRAGYTPVEQATDCWIRWVTAAAGRRLIAPRAFQDDLEFLCILASLHNYGQA